MESGKDSLSAVTLEGDIRVSLPAGMVSIAPMMRVFRITDANIR